MAPTHPSLVQWQTLIGRWNDDTFKRPLLFDSAKGPLHHLRKEADECLEAFAKGEMNRAALAEELADILVLACASAHYAGIDLETALYCKMEENVSRKWGKPDENDSVFHVRNDPDEYEHETEGQMAERLANMEGDSNVPD